MKSSDQGNILAIKLLDPGRERINWRGCYEKCYTDIKVFNPLAPSNSGTTLQSCYRKHEITKKRAYELRIREVKHSSFTPLMFSASGGMGHEASVFYKRLASFVV